MQTCKVGGSRRRGGWRESAEDRGEGGRGREKGERGNRQGESESERQKKRRKIVKTTLRRTKMEASAP